MAENESDLLENQNTLRERVGKSLLNSKVSIFISILVVLFTAQIFKFTFPDLIFWGIPLALLAIWLISWFKEIGWSDLGLDRPESWTKTIRLAFLAMLIVQIVGFLQFTLLSDSSPDYSSYEEAMTFWRLLGWIAISWTTAGIGEEIIWRGFFIKQIARLFDEQKMSSWVIGLVLSSIGFGLAHFHQGIGGMLGTAFVGIVYGIFYLRSGRNLWVSIIAHGLTGTTSFILLYLSQLQ
ncbi:CPBP family intramembrane glutamic endopeptidase [Chloroflexota bacterium]